MSIHEELKLSAVFLIVFSLTLCNICVFRRGIDSLMMENFQIVKFCKVVYLKKEVMFESIFFPFRVHRFSGEIGAPGSKQEVSKLSFVSTVTDNLPGEPIS